MKKPDVRRLLLVFTLLVGIIVVIPQLRDRAEIEATQKQVELVMSWQDIQKLADSAGEPVETWLTGMHDAGLYRVLLTDEELADAGIADTVTAAGLETAQVGGMPQGGRYVFAALYDEKSSVGKRPGLLYEMETLPEETVRNGLSDTNATLILVENEPQTGAILPDGWTLENWTGDTVKCAWLTNYLRSRYQVLGYDGPQEIVNICFRAVVDRGMTTLWMSPFLAPGKVMVDDLTVYQDAFSQLEQRLNAAGYTYGEATPIPYLPLWQHQLGFLGLGVFSLAVLLVGTVFPVKKDWVLWLLLALGCIESFAGAYLAPELQRTALALLVALVFPAAAIVLLGRRLERLRQRPARFPAGGYLTTLALTAAVAVAGGLYIGAILGTSDCMLILRLFRGVKLSQMAVYLFAMVWLAWALLHIPGNTLREDGRALLRENRSRWKAKLLILVLFFAAVCAVYILRSGDGMLAVSAWELRLRNGLETALSYRPRTKEFLIAWPALAPACLCAARGKRLFAWLFGVLGSIGFASVVNTFCHIRAHVLVSLARTGLGLILGVVLGMLLLLILGAVWKGGGEEAPEK